MSRYLFLSWYVTLCSFGVLRSQSLFDEYDFRCEERRDQKIAAKLQLYEDKIKALENQIKSIDLKNQQGELVYSNYGKKTISTLKKSWYSKKNVALPDECLCYISFVNIQISDTF